MSDLFGQTKNLESQDQIVGPEDHFHIGGIGPEAVCWDLCHRIRIFEFPQQEFLKTAVAVEAPDCRWSQIQVGHQCSVIGILLEREQTPLNLRGFQSYGSAHGHKAMLGLPMKGCVGKLGSLPAFGEVLISCCHHSFFQRLLHTGDYYISQVLSFQRFDDCFVVESTVESDTGTRRGSRARELCQDASQKVGSSRAGTDIAWSQFHAEAQSSSIFAGNEWCVGRLAVTPLGHIAPSYPFLRSISDQACGIGVDHSAVKQAESMEEFRPQFVVGRLETPEFSATKAKQKGSQRVPMWEVVQAQQRRNQSIVNQTLSVLDPADAGNDSEDVRQENVGWMVLALLVIGPLDGELKEVPNCKTATKRPEETESSIARK